MQDSTLNQPILTLVFISIVRRPSRPNLHKMPDITLIPRQQLSPLRTQVSQYMTIYVSQKLGYFYRIVGSFATIIHLFQNVRFYRFYPQLDV